MLGILTESFKDSLSSLVLGYFSLTKVYIYLSDGAFGGSPF